MAAKPNVQPNCVVGTSTENKSNIETKSSPEESGLTFLQILLNKRKYISPEKLNQSSK